MRWRSCILPVLALLAVAVVIGAQLAARSDDRPAEPTPAAACTASRTLPPVDGKELVPVVEYVVLDGVAQAACDLGVSRERLLIALAGTRSRSALAAELGITTAVLAERLKAGLKTSVRRLASDDRLPPVSSLLDTHSRELGLPGVVAAALPRVPSRVVDGLLPSHELFASAIDRIDLDQLLAGTGGRERIEELLRDAVLDAAFGVAREQLIDAARFWR